MSVKDEVADTIGLTGYAVDSEGIGGVLKSRVADFRVDEISTKISLDPEEDSPPPISHSQIGRQTGSLGN